MTYRESTNDHHNRMHGLCIHGETRGDCDKVEYTDAPSKYKGNLNELAAKINANAAAHGFWDEERNFAEMLFLIMSEAAEAGEEHRAGNPDYYEHMIDRGNGVRVAKPEGISVELVDILIRTLDTLHSRGVDIDWILEAKMAYNAGREYKHGKAY